ncbi:hypothetical protein FDA09_17095 [Clostridium botulinum]|uniref:hypothetical protein n=1 Tax=Clostridium botulinum TaxID=1491 RepID=UPI000774B083|nr:hypothetical protein [Clostridium botulinum]NFH81690.1 hypothetical protein [Clostridium botulinum]NFH84906.1 hypothetical protein [Clostridium botulinum]NFI13047.1 hypothetical protein [Clostridium botulinum]NFI16111.1 hypothetical protein [Clostridium botulinum]NFO85930.1 hypothetical protein [Clostridium botulinum]
MEYISEKEFRKQPMEVQQVIFEWWRPSKGDLFENDLMGGFGAVAQDNLFNNGLIPLLSEGQLRKFIEDKTGCIMMVQYDFLDNTYEIYLSSNSDNEEDYGWIHNLGIDLLQAYWKVACQIASKEVVEHGQIK